MERESGAPDDSVTDRSQTEPVPTTEVRRVAAPARASRARSAEASTETATDSGVDRAFHEAWRVFRSGDARAAAAAFDELLRRQDLGDRRADVLFWSARAHQQAGEAGTAHERFEDLVRSHPGAWHEAEARGALANQNGNE